MHPDDAAVDLVRETLMLTLKVAAPILLAGVLIGLVISLFQSITSIQDQTLTAVPKIIGMVLVTIVLMPWILQWLIAFTTEMLRLV